jgi:hypothetical protein
VAFSADSCIFRDCLESVFCNDSSCDRCCTRCFRSSSRDRIYAIPNSCKCCNVGDAVVCRFITTSPFFTLIRIYSPCSFYGGFSFCCPLCHVPIAQSCSKRFRFSKLPVVGAWGAFAIVPLGRDISGKDRLFQQIPRIRKRLTFTDTYNISYLGRFCQFQLLFFL